MAADVGVLSLDWAAVTAITSRLAEKIRADAIPDVVVGVLRGGMIPAVCLAHALGLREVRALDVRHTASDRVNAAKTAGPVTQNPASLGRLTDLDVLLVDDIAGTGQTMRASRSLIAAQGARRVRTAAWVLNEANWLPGNSDQDATFTYIGAAHRTWVIFPWEDQ